MPRYCKDCLKQLTRADALEDLERCRSCNAIRTTQRRIQQCKPRKAEPREGHTPKLVKADDLWAQRLKGRTFRY